jgi:hypothetical protein
VNYDMDLIRKIFNKRVALEGVKKWGGSCWDNLNIDLQHDPEIILVAMNYSDDIEGDLETIYHSSPSLFRQPDGTQNLKQQAFCDQLIKTEW